LGTAAVRDPHLVTTLIKEHGAQRIIVGVDARAGQVATQGWLETSSVGALDLIRSMRAGGVERIVYTDIERDGTLTSPNFEAVAEVAALDVAVIASGGVARIDEMVRLARIPGVEAAIVVCAFCTLVRVT